MRLLLIIFFLSVIGIRAATEYHIMTNGLSTGDGSYDSPWDITTGFSTADAVPGSTVWIHGGTYGFGSNVYACTLLGTSNAPIIVRQAPGERAIIDGGITGGANNWVTFWGFEITCRNIRTNLYAHRPAGLIMSGRGQRAINLTMRDTGHPAIGGGGSEVYGCVMWGVGIYEYDNNLTFPTNPWPRGSQLYLQNPGTWEYEVRDNISSRAINAGMKGYTENGTADNFTFDGNVVFENGGEGVEIDSLFNSITSARVWNTFTYHCVKTPMGYYEGPTLFQHQSLIYSNNYIIEKPGPSSAALWLKRWRILKVVNNTIVTTCQSNDWGNGFGTGNADAFGGKFLELYYNTNQNLAYTINSNAYHGGVEQGGEWYESGGMFQQVYVPFRHQSNQVAITDGTNGNISFAKWQTSHGFDLNSTYTTNMPTTDTFATLRTNRYERGRANIVVINWRTNTAVDVNLSTAGLTNGQPFVIRDAQNYFGTNYAYSNVFNVSLPTVSIPLTLTNASPPTVTGDTQRLHTASLFNAFVLTPVETMVTNAVEANFSARRGNGRGKRTPLGAL